MAFVIRGKLSAAPNDEKLTPAVELEEANVLEELVHRLHPPIRRFQRKTS